MILACLCSICGISVVQFVLEAYTNVSLTTEFPLNSEDWLIFCLQESTS